MSKIGRQQLSPSLLNDIKEDIKKDLDSIASSGTVTMGDVEPNNTPANSLWFQTGIGSFNPTTPEDKYGTLFIRNGVVSDDLPSDFDPKEEIWFDIEE